MNLPSALGQTTSFQAFGKYVLERESHGFSIKESYHGVMV